MDINEEQYEIRQFKLASGEEVVCQIIQWHNEEELEIVVRKPMKLVMGEMAETGVRYYSFRPWMVYQENPEDLIVLNGHHVIGIGFPPKTLIAQYDEAVDEMAQMNKQREIEYEEAHPTSKDIENITKKVKASAKGIEDYLTLLKNDSDFSNVIQFDPKKVHQEYSTLPKRQLKYNMNYNFCQALFLVDMRKKMQYNMN